MKRIFFEDDILPDNLNSETDTIFSNKIAIENGLGEDFRVINYPIYNKETLENVAAEVFDKYNKYIQILGNRLNYLHGLKLNLNFWDKALSMQFMRMLTSLYEFYLKAKTIPDNCDYKKFDFAAFTIPSDLEEVRKVLQSDVYSDRLLFNLYRSIQNQSQQTYKKVKGKRIKKLTIRDKIRFFIKNMRSRKVGAVGVLFDIKKLRSFGFEVKNVKLYDLKIDSSNANINLRKELFAWELDFDEFDKFSFWCFTYLFPSIYVENFEKSFNTFKKNILAHKNLYSHLICEYWISGSKHSFLLALSKELAGTLHINNEHNALMFPFCGCFSDFVIKKSDFYITIGWDDYNKRNNIVKGASLRDYSVSSESIKNSKEILHVAAPGQAKMSLFSSMNSQSGDFFVKSHLQNLDIYFSNLSYKVREKLVYRPHPKGYKIPFNRWEKEKILSKHLNGLNINEESERIGFFLKNFRLVIVDYFSTVILECLANNVPVIVLASSNAYFLKDEHSNFFKPLEEASICIRNAERAAKFVNNLIITDSVEEWWNKEKTIQCRNDFTSANFSTNINQMIRAFNSIIN